MDTEELKHSSNKKQCTYLQFLHSFCLYWLKNVPFKARSSIYLFIFLFFADELYIETVNFPVLDLDPGISLSAWKKKAEEIICL